MSDAWADDNLIVIATWMGRARRRGAIVSIWLVVGIAGAGRTIGNAAVGANGDQRAAAAHDSRPLWVIGPIAIVGPQGAVGILAVDKRDIALSAIWHGRSLGAIDHGVAGLLECCWPVKRRQEILEMVAAVANVAR